MSDLLKQINSLTIFGGLRKTEPLKGLANFLRYTETVGTPSEVVIEAYSDFVGKLYDMRPDADFSGALWDALEADINVYLKAEASSILADICGTEPVKLSRMVENAAERELDLLTQIGRTSSADLELLLFGEEYIPQFSTSGMDMKSNYKKFLLMLGTDGFGEYRHYTSFYTKDSKILPLVRSGEVSLDYFVGYDKQRKVIADNILAFLDGRAYADMLLYGCSGSGKSTAVRAAAKAFASRGLRIVEVPGTDLVNLQAILDNLSIIPMRFILFIDDVNPSVSKEVLAPLQRALDDGSTNAVRNVLLCAVADCPSCADNAGEDKFISSMSDRFGIRIRFDSPSKEEYLDMCRQLINSNGMKVSDE
ncbi:MAG: ATP-binding protein, partial [Saccharofermentans sp.]|nr:ATP-binding protein [Saccharofermentans sp.]